jgi:pyruvate dehydrogenase phosphatase regulatory subunit
LLLFAGSGAVANSVAYHLTRNGWKDILILEQNKIKSGTSHVSTGLVGLFKPFAMRRVINESLNMYKELESLGYDVGLVKSGSINLAQTQDRVIALKRRMSYSKVEGLECEFVTPKDIQELHPYLVVDDLLGGVYVPEDSYADAQKVCDALIDVVKKSGVQYREQCQVKYILTDATTNSVIGVETDAGVVNCEYFVNAAGMWSRELGLKCKKPVKIPAYPAEHYYLITNGMNIPEGLAPLPCVRDYDSSNYSRQDNDEFLIGWFEDEASTVFEGSVPKDWMKDIHENLQVHLEKIWDKLVERYPALNASQGAPYVRSSPDTFTPDGRWILGESPEVNKYFVAVGTNGNSIQGAGGIGKFVAEWIIAGRPTQELFSFSIQRFLVSMIKILHKYT